MIRTRTILQDYLNMRRGLGFKLKKHDAALRQFVSFFAANGAARLTTAIALEWVKKPQDTNPAWWTERLSILRGFAMFWKTRDPRVEVPPMGLLTAQYRRPAPYIYDDDEIRRILVAAKELPAQSGLRGATYHALFGLLSATGMRVGETREVTCKDVDLAEGVITVRNAKFNKSRLVPLHRSTRNALRVYARHRDGVFGREQTPAFFVGDGGAGLSHAVIWKTLVRLLRHIGLRGPSAASAPRVHDLRHTFAVKALTRIYREGKDMDRRIHALSTYLGHSGPGCTYWYLTAVPELMQLALRRLEKRIGGQR